MTATELKKTSDALWLEENGPKELERLFQAVVYHPLTPILIADGDGQYKDVSVGAARLLGLPREKLIGQTLADFATPDLKLKVPQLLQDLLAQGELEGTLHLKRQDGATKQVEYKARKNVLPTSHVFVLQDEVAGNGSAAGTAERIERWVQDYALYLLDKEGRIKAWYAGAERIYGYTAGEVLDRNIVFLYDGDKDLAGKLREEFHRAETCGHMGSEQWRKRKDGSRFWANTITMRLRDESGKLQGFARIVRDFSDRHERDEKLRLQRARIRPLPVQTAIVGVISGEFDRIPEANDAFLDMVGYSREDLESGILVWPDLTPPEYAPLDDVAHEEGLMYGACTPFEKELIRKDGRRVSVLISTAVLKLSPFHWISFVQDLSERDRFESVVHEEVQVRGDFEEIVGMSPALLRVQQQVEVVAPTDATVLILGETGTGKELVARAIHKMSPRNKMPFITLNCAAIPTGLLESELFGYERGAFTGALTQKIGRFEMAHRGTLFLDEVGDIPIDLQPKLLRALQEKSFERLGGTKTIPIDVRLLAATNRDLTQMMGDKLFRSDLYYRLKVFPITTPPLRDRVEDIPVLVRHFTKKYNEKMGRNIDRIPVEIMKALVDWRWPGNVRELENFIERAVILSTGSTLRAPINEIRKEAGLPSNEGTLEEVEKAYIIRVLRECAGVVSTAATRLGMPRTTLNAMMKKLGVERREL